MCTSIWKEGMRRREPDSSQYHPVLGQKAWGQLNTLFFFFLILQRWSQTVEYPSVEMLGTKLDKVLGSLV